MTSPTSHLPFKKTSLSRCRSRELSFVISVCDDELVHGFLFALQELTACVFPSPQIFQNRTEDLQNRKGKTQSSEVTRTL